MPKFRYRATDPLGQAVAGEIDARDARDAALRLIGMSCLPLSVEQVKVPLPLAGLALLRGFLRGLFAGRKRGQRDPAGPSSIRASINCRSAPAGPPPSDQVHLLPTMPPPVGPLYQPPPDDRPQPATRVERTIIEILRAGGYRPVPELVEAELGKFVPDDLPDEEREAWLYFRALAAEGPIPTEEALRRATSAHKLYPNSARIRLLLARQYDLRGDTASMFELLDGAELAADQLGHCLFMARLAYLWDQPQRALQYIEPLLDEYRRRIDRKDLRLIQRGLPTVPDTVWCALAMHHLRNELPAAQHLLDGLCARLPMETDDLRLWIASKQQGNMTPLAEYAELRLAFSGGLLPLQAAVLRAQMAQDVDQAARILHAVILPAAQAPFLDNVRMLAAAELANRAGDEERESALRRELLNRLPMLLEPSLAAFFNLLEYQETLKKEYQQVRAP